MYKQEEIDEQFDIAIGEETETLRGFTGHFIISNPRITGLTPGQMENIDALDRIELIIAYINIRLQEYDEFSALTPDEINNIRERLNQNNHNLNIN